MDEGNHIPSKTCFRFGSLFQSSSPGSFTRAHGQLRSILSSPDDSPPDCPPWPVAMARHHVTTGMECILPIPPSKS